MIPNLRSTLKPVLAGLLFISASLLASAQTTEGFPPKDKPWVPGWGFYAKWPEGWGMLHNQLVDRAAKGGVDVMFLGDSLVFNWQKEGKAEWDARFAPLKAANFGIGGDSTRQVIWRLQNNELDGITPKLVVLQIGTNNLYRDHNAGTDDEIVQAIAAIVQLIHEKSPATKVLIVGLLPRQNQFFCDRATSINVLLLAYTKKANIAFADFTDAFAGAKGATDVIKPELFNADRIHLSPAGYKVFADLLEPMVKKQLGK